jgi:hypothetical protein
LDLLWPFKDNRFLFAIPQSGRRGPIRQKIWLFVCEETYTFPLLALYTHDMWPNADLAKKHLLGNDGGIDSATINRHG